MFTLTKGRDSVAAPAASPGWLLPGVSVSFRRATFHFVPLVLFRMEEPLPLPDVPPGVVT